MEKIVWVGDKWNRMYGGVVGVGSEVNVLFDSRKWTVLVRDKGSGLMFTTVRWCLRRQVRRARR